MTTTSTDLERCHTQLAETSVSRDELALQLALRTRELENLQGKAEIDAAHQREALATALCQREATLRDQAQAHQTPLGALREALDCRAKDERDRLVNQVDEVRQETGCVDARNKRLEEKVADPRELVTNERTNEPQAALSEVGTQRDVHSESLRLQQGLETLISEVAVLRKPPTF